ncbi:MAG: hypothetical protein NTY38_03095 [Acidobacteria bacterium]|nr:hypothetical protein [Acidobacteriota bacterium]
MRLQTGTVAGVISLTPSFATASGGIDVTPASPAALSLNVAQAAPRILNVLVSSRTTDGFTLQVTGYATGRSITQMDFQFVPLPGENVTTTKLSVPVEAAFNTWYQSTASQAYGSQFTVTVPFTLQGTLTNAKTLAETIQSVSVTLTNRQGASAASSIVLR